MSLPKKLLPWLAILAMCAVPPGARADAPPIPQPPDDLPDSFSVVGQVLYLAEAAYVCQFRDETWMHNVERDVGNATNNTLRQIYPSGVPDDVQKSATEYGAEALEAGNAFTPADCDALQKSGYLKIPDVAAANASN